MFVKTPAIFAILAVAAQVAVAAPPACVIAAVNTQPDPSDFKTVCAASEVSKYISDNCGGNLKAATDYISSVCEDNGEEYKGSSVDEEDKDSSSSASATGTATQTSGGPNSPTGFTTATGGSSASATQSAGAAEQSGSAASVRVGMDVLGMAGLGVVGAILAL